MKNFFEKKLDDDFGELDFLTFLGVSGIVICGFPNVYRVAC